MKLLQKDFIALIKIEILSLQMVLAVGILHAIRLE